MRVLVSLLIGFCLSIFLEKVLKNFVTIFLHIKRWTWLKLKGLITTAHSGTIEEKEDRR